MLVLRRLLRVLGAASRAARARLADDALAGAVRARRRVASVMTSTRSSSAVSLPAPQVMRSTSPSRVRNVSSPLPPSSVSPTWSTAPPGPGWTSPRARAHSVVVALAAARRVLAEVGKDRVVAGAAVLGVVAGAAGHPVVAVLAERRVVAAAAVDAVARVAAAQRVVAGGAEDAVERGAVARVVRVAADGVVAAAAVEPVVALDARDRVVARHRRRCGRCRARR